MSDLLDGKYVLVTGGTQGLGAAIALRVAREGAAGVAIVGRDPERGAQVVAELMTGGAAAMFVQAELSDAGQCAAVVPAVVERFARLDGLVNAAATTARGTLAQTTVEQFDQIMATNVRAPMQLIRATVAQLVAQGDGGAIVNILSTSSYGGQPHLVAYSTSKGALATLTKNVAHAHRFDRIRVNGINLGWTDTPNEHRVQRTHGAPADWLARAQASLPMGRLAQPDEVADLVALLLSDRGGIMTGALIDYAQEVVGASD